MVVNKSTGPNEGLLVPPVLPAGASDGATVVEIGTSVVVLDGEKVPELSTGETDGVAAKLLGCSVAEVEDGLMGAFNEGGVLSTVAPDGVSVPANIVGTKLSSSTAVGGVGMIVGDCLEGDPLGIFVFVAAEFDEGLLVAVFSCNEDGAGVTSFSSSGVCVGGLEVFLSVSCVVGEELGSSFLLGVIEGELVGDVGVTLSLGDKV